MKASDLKTGTGMISFTVVNPLNNSMSFLSPIPFPLCRCNLFGCICEAIPLKLTVNMEGQGLQSSISSYKTYIMERKQLPRPLRLNSKDISSHFRIIIYDSMTNFWASTDVKWIGSSSRTKIFPMWKGEFYVSAGCYQGERFGDSLHDILYKFKDGRFVGNDKRINKSSIFMKIATCYYFQLVPSTVLKSVPARSYLSFWSLGFLASFFSKVFNLLDFSNILWKIYKVKAQKSFLYKWFVKCLKCWGF